MRILVTLTYYRPHYSGLTIYAERTARALAARGHTVTVLTSQYSPDLPLHEVRDEVEIVRLPVWARVSKGVLMPGMALKALAYARRSDVVNLHLPQLDAAPISLLARLVGKPVVLTYQCDLKLPHGGVNWLANQVSHLANHISARAANVIVTTSQDYAQNSAFLRSYLHKVRPILPPVEIAAVSDADRAAFRRKAGIQAGQRIIGMAARLASEKGVEYLAQALPLIMEKHPGARVIFVGQHEKVFGEEQYAQRLAPLIRSLGDHWKFMGIVSPVDLSAFFHECEVTVLPSLNSTEAFGIVQVESMMAGTPVVASDLPGVRQPVALSGMGKIVPPADAGALAQAITTILDQPEHFTGGAQDVRAMFSLQSTAQAYENLFDELVGPGKIRPNVQEHRLTTGILASAGTVPGAAPKQSALPHAGVTTRISQNPSSQSNGAVPPKDFLWLHLRDLPYFRAVLRSVEAHFYQDFSLASPILDVGCGDGHFASVTFDKPLDVGLDPWTGPIRQAQRLGGYRMLVQGDGGVMPFPDGYFGSALSNSVLEHIPHVQIVLAETSRVLRPGAPFLFCVPNPGYLRELAIPALLGQAGLRGLGAAYTEWFRRISRVHHAEPVEVWQDWLEDAGFRLERWWHYFPPPAMRVLEWGHYFGAPSQLFHLLTRRWILAPYRWNLALTRRLVSAYAEPAPHSQGVFTFFVARKPG